MIKELLASKSTLEYFYILTGIILWFYAYMTLKDEKHEARIGTAIFWFVLGLIFVGGKWLPPVVSGALVVLIALLAGLEKIGKGTYFSTTLEFQQKRREELGNKLLIPIVLISGTAIAFALAKLHPLVGLGVGSVLALIATKFYAPKDSFAHILDSGRETSDRLGWALVLPPYLAALGALFNKAGVGEIVSELVKAIFPVGTPLGAIVAYAFGMAIFTIIMGNAFAAFAVITSGIGVPLLIKAYGVDPAVATALAMTAGYCGTLTTPMAANFNIVPVALLDIKDKYKVIKVQIPMAIVLWVTHIILMYVLLF
ncbi:DUF979 domain-containing protein [Thermococcus aggregans]|uniref:DUF979 domain-containing protein n=1 Tax=Thermococcus aggregans TaxID=110163 RepID=A0A9E7MX87_THEAG|nr:DUF979 domain-containing protein [Thermococcus aggregans]USS40490.1 DUF979 domain-containing protein [Thermococcus aggregans]